MAHDQVLDAQRLEKGLGDDPWGIPQCSVSPTSPRYEHNRVTGTPVPSEMRAMYSDATLRPLFSMISAGFLPPSQAPAHIENPTPSFPTGTYWMSGSASTRS